MRDVTMPASLMLAASLAISAAASPASVPSPAEAEMQLRSLNHRFADAYQAGDPDFVAASTAQDFLLIDIDGEWLDRDAFLARSGPSAGRVDVAYDDVQVRLFGDAAVIHGVLHARTPDGTPTHVRYTDVYAREGGRWRRVGAQRTPVKIFPATPDAASMDDAGSFQAAITPWHGTDPDGNDIAVLTALNAQYVQAFRDADVAWYDAHLSPDYQVVFGDGSLHGRAAALADFAKPYYAEGIASFPLDKVGIRRFGDVALIHAENAYELKDGRKGINRYTDIWVKQHGRWRCIAAHITVRQAPR